MNEKIKRDEEKKLCPKCKKPLQKEYGDKYFSCWRCGYNEEQKKLT